MCGRDLTSTRIINELCTMCSLIHLFYFQDLSSAFIGLLAYICTNAMLTYLLYLFNKPRFWWCNLLPLFPSSESLLFLALCFSTYMLESVPQVLGRICAGLIVYLRRTGIFMIQSFYPCL